MIYTFREINLTDVLYYEIMEVIASVKDVSLEHKEHTFSSFYNCVEYIENGIVYETPGKTKHQM